MRLAAVLLVECPQKTTVFPSLTGGPHVPIYPGDHKMKLKCPHCGNDITYDERLAVIMLSVYLVFTW